MAPLNEFTTLSPEEQIHCDQFEQSLDQRVGSSAEAGSSAASYWLTAATSLTYEMIQELKRRYLERGWGEVTITPFSERTYQVWLRP